jgi:hypothetical protein
LVSRLTLGAELIVEHETIQGEDESSLTRVLLGPMLLYKPTRNTHLGLVPLFGLNSDSLVAEVVVVFGIDFEAFSLLGSNKSESGRGERGFEPVRRPR